MSLVVPLAAARLARGGSRVDRYFFGTCPATMATFGFSGLVALVYLVLSPFARRATPGLLAVNRWLSLLKR